MRKILLGLMLAIGLLCACTKDKTTTYNDKLTFGTGVNYSNFQLSGEGTTFTTGAAAYVYFRLESKTALDGNSVKFVVFRDGVALPAYIFSTNPKPTGHIFITPFGFNIAGSYSVSAYLIGNLSKETLVTTASFEML